MDSPLRPYYLFLDDLRVPAQVDWVKLPPFEWTIVRSYGEFVAAIEKRGLPEYVTFDHDLGMDAMLAANAGIEYTGPEKTGMDCARYLVNYCLDRGLSLPTWSVHSINPIGKENLKSFLRSAHHSILMSQADLSSFWDAQAEWSRATFGSDQERGPIGPLKHLAKEAVEAQAKPTDLSEYVDCLFLTFDATRRAGFTFDQLCAAAWEKLAVNRARSWPKPTSSDQPVEHDRSADPAT